MTDFSDYNQLINKEKQAERRAMAILRGANFTECLRINNLEAAITVTTAKGKEVNIQGRDVYNTATWNKFLVSIDQRPDIYQLTDVVDNLTGKYIQWLTHEYTERYQCIKKPEHETWLSRVVRLAVTRRIMENKYYGYAHENRDTFADAAVAYDMTMLTMLNEAVQGAAKAVHHIIRAPEGEDLAPEQKEQRNGLIEDWFNQHYQRIQTTALPSAEKLQLSASVESNDHE